jgi:hypothetical protein
MPIKHVVSCFLFGQKKRIGYVPPARVYAAGEDTYILYYVHSSSVE